jgi:hypothetical protein
MNESKNTTKFGKGNPGKPKGAINKNTKLAKDAIALAAEGLGGTERLIEWAKEDPLNERAFWTTIYTKLLPLQVQAAVSGGLNNSLEVVFKSAN